MAALQESAIDGKAGEIPGLGLDWLHLGPGFGIVRWDCSRGRREVSEEKRQLWHVVSFVHRGAFVLHAEGRSRLVDPTSVVFYNPDSPFRTEHPFGCDDRGSALVIHQDLLREVVSCHDPERAEGGGGLFRTPHAEGMTQACLHQRLIVRRILDGEPPDPLAIEAAVLELLGAMTGALAHRDGIEAGRRDPARARRRYVEEAKLLLRDRFRERLHLEDISRTLHVSTYHLCRLFKEQTGIPIHRYLNKLRLLEALEPVVEGRDDLSTLALDVGFSSHSHFTAAFRKEFGTTPREVRARGRLPGSLPGDVGHP